MFSGIIEAVGEVARVGSAPHSGVDGARAHRLDLRLGSLLEGLQPGASVAVNGACLTLVQHNRGLAAFDVIPETWEHTSLRLLQPGDAVNIERSLRLGDRIDGHFVQGHVDGVGRVERIDRQAGEWKLWVAADAELMPCILRKGSIALDGTSLTVVDVAGTSFSVALIPTTLERTVLGRRRPGHLVNIETDLLVRAVLSRLAAAGLTGPARTGASGLSYENLSAGGYL